jgi:dihydropteroate synthase
MYNKSEVLWIDWPDMNSILLEQTALNDKLSQRFIALDPGGYFLIYLDRDLNLICADHYSNEINDKGLAVDPDSGEVIACDGGQKRLPTVVFNAKTAKELCIEIFEQADHCVVTCLDHAAYLGREFMKAEAALAQGKDYVQD